MTAWMLRFQFLRARFDASTYGRVSGQGRGGGPRSRALRGNRAPSEPTGLVVWTRFDSRLSNDGATRYALDRRAAPADSTFEDAGDRASGLSDSELDSRLRVRLITFFRLSFFADACNATRALSMPCAKRAGIGDVGGVWRVTSVIVATGLDNFSPTINLPRFTR